MTIARRTLGSLLVLFSVTATGLAGSDKATAAAAAPATRPAGFDALVEQLGADDSKAREAAQAAIVKMGDAAVKAVEELAATARDPEMAERARSILKQIDAESLARPSLVTLKFRKAKPSEVYASLFKQANAKMEFWPPTMFDERFQRPEKMPPVTVDLENVPFWEAMVALEEQTGLFVQDMGSEMKLTERHGAGPAVAGGGRNVSINGPFMVVAGDRFAGPMIHELSVFVEPRIRVIGNPREVSEVEAFDVNGDPVQPAPHERQIAAMRARARAAGREFDGFGGNAFRVSLPNEVPRAGHFRGTVRVLVAADEQVIEIPDVAKANNVERKVDGRRFLLNAMNPDPGEWFITMVAYNDGPDGSGLMKTKVELLDANDNAFQSGGRGMNGGGNRVAFHIEFKQGPNVGPPAKLRVTFPADAREIDIPFEFGKKPEGGNAKE